MMHHSETMEMHDGLHQEIHHGVTAPREEGREGRHQHEIEEGTK